jgi:hypothetical protein
MRVNNKHQTRKFNHDQTPRALGPPKRGIKGRLQWKHVGNRSKADSSYLKLLHRSTVGATMAFLVRAMVNTFPFLYQPCNVLKLYIVTSYMAQATTDSMQDQNFGPWGNSQHISGSYRSPSYRSPMKLQLYA